MKTTVSMAEEMVPSRSASPRATAPVVVAVAAAVVAVALALAVTPLWLLWLGHPTSLGALADTALAERVLAALHWYMAHAPHGLPLPVMHPVVGGLTVHLM